MSSKGNPQKLHQCRECGIHYKSHATAKKCEAWCKANKSCNLEIIKDAIENQPLTKMDKDE